MAWGMGLLGAAGAGAAGSYELIESVILSSNQSSVTFSNLGNYSSTYKHLQIRAVARTDRSGNGDNIGMRFNGDTASTYNWHLLAGTGSSVITSSGATTYMLPGWVSANNTTANAFGAAIIDLLDAYSSSKNKTIRSLTGLGATETNIRLMSGLWRSTSSVTSTTLFPVDGTNFVSGSRFSLYGIKG